MRMYLSSLNTLPWVLMGDYSNFLDENEKIGRVPHPPWLLRRFTEAVRESGLSNFDFMGYQFTWERGRGTPNSVQEKLDRVLVSGNWRDVFSNAKAWRRPRFENSWGRNPECRRVTEQAWSEFEGLDIANQLAECGKAVWGWRKRESGRDARELRQCTESMRWNWGSRED
nr:uncharacterized protein LOC109156647 [Ipomoea trifida]